MTTKGAVTFTILAALWVGGCAWAVWAFGPTGPWSGLPQRTHDFIVWLIAMAGALLVVGSLCDEQFVPRCRRDRARKG